MSGARGDGVQAASQGHGPLLQRDYWAVLDREVRSATEAATCIASRFCDLSPPGMLRFERTGDSERPLRPGDELEVHLPLAGTFGVRVTHKDRLSLTVVTLPGHPEAGRITFGAYPNREGEVVIHVRSRARSGTARRYFGFLAVGEPMQTITWSEFIDRLAAALGSRVRDVIHAETREVEETNEDGPDGIDRPTYRAVGP